jgi:hypothetical protein
MNKENIHASVSALLEDISEQNKQIAAHKGVIPLIEMDIILQNIARLYEQMTLLKKINSLPVSEIQIPEPVAIQSVKQEIKEPLKVEHETISPLKEKAPIVSFVVRPAFVAEAIKEKEEVSQGNESNSISQVIDILVKPDDSAQPTINPVVLNESHPVVSHEPLSPAPVQDEEAITIPVDSQKSHPVNTTTKKVTSQSIGLFDAFVTVADKYEEQPTLHDKISKNKPDSSLGKKYQKKPVEDLKKSIGINEKFSFINELFEGDLNSYNQAIEELNLSSGIEQALQLIQQELLPKYKWNTDNKAFMSLTDLVERRFMK